MLSLTSPRLAYEQLVADSEEVHVHSGNAETEPLRARASLGSVVDRPTGDDEGRPATTPLEVELAAAPLGDAFTSTSSSAHLVHSAGGYGSGAERATRTGTRAET